MGRVIMKFYDIPDIVELGNQEADPKKKVLVNMDGISGFSEGGSLFIIITTDNLPDPESTRLSPGMEQKLELFKGVDKEVGNYFVVIDSGRYYINNPNQVRVKSDNIVFEFHVNPQRVNISDSKLQTEIRTRGGWEIQHWGNQLGEISVNGHTGGMHKKESIGSVVPLESGETVVDSIAWKKLSKLRDLYYNNNSGRNKKQKLLSLNYYGDLYTGYFKDFKGPDADAENPYLIDYSFVFKVVSRIKSDGWIDLSTG